MSHGSLAKKGRKGQGIVEVIFFVVDRRKRA